MLYAIVAALLFVMPLSAEHRMISAEKLNNWIEQEKSMVILDVRSKKIFDGKTLPGALWIPYTSEDEAFESVLPKAKKKTIVIYCVDEKCPASGRVYDRLLKMDYTNLYEYHEGYKDWVRKGYPLVDWKDER